MSEADQILNLDREWNEAYPRLDAAAKIPIRVLTSRP